MHWLCVYKGGGGGSVFRNGRGGGGGQRERESPIDPIDQHLATVHLRQLSTNTDGLLGAVRGGGGGGLPKVHTTFSPNARAPTCKDCLVTGPRPVFEAGPPQRRGGLSTAD